ncbi:MAG: hypothetical protein ACE5MM_05420 [Nitrospiraceae bacterium]
MRGVKRFLDKLSTSGNVVLEKDQASVRHLTERASDLVQKQSAKIAVESEEGKGATFTIIFPRGE